MKLEVTVSDLMKTSSDLNKACSDLRGQIAELRRATETLNGCWEGPAQQAFAQREAEMNAWYEQMAGVVDEYAASMAQAAQKYTETDSEAAGNIRSH